MTSPASSIYGIEAATIMLPVDAASLPVDKGGLAPQPPWPARFRLQRACYIIAAALTALGAMGAVVVDPAVFAPLVSPIALAVIAGLALGMSQPSLRQRLMLWSVVTVLLACLGIGLLPYEAGAMAEALRDFGFMASTAAALLSALCSFLPPYRRDKAGQGDAMLRVAATVFCSWTLLLTYLSVFFICTPDVH